MSHPIELSALEQQASAYFDHHAIDAFEGLSTLYNLRVSRASQRLSVLADVHDIDARIHTLLQYLEQHTEALTYHTDELFKSAAQLNTLDEADAFALSLCAFNSKNPAWIAQVVTFFKGLPDERQGVAYALFYLPWESVSQWIADFLRSKDFTHKYIALLACQLRSIYPAKHIAHLIEREDCQADTALFAILLTSVGYAQDTRFGTILNSACEHENSEVKTAALLARLMLKDRTALDESKAHSLTDNPAFYILSPWIILSESSAHAKQYLSKVMSNSEIAQDLKILAIGHQGDPELLDWLLKTTQACALQPLLALVLTQITGMDVSQLAQRSIQHEEDNEHDVFLPEDHSLPNTQRAALLTFWQKVQSQFNKGERYFFGRSLQQKQGFSITKGNAVYIIAQNTMQYYAVLSDNDTKYVKTVPIKLYP